MRTKPEQQKDDLMKDFEETLQAIHPGKMLRDFMGARGLTPDEMMKKTGMPVQNILEFMEGKRKFTDKVAPVFKLSVGPFVQKLVEAQTYYDLLWEMLWLKVRSWVLKSNLAFYPLAHECNHGIAKMNALLDELEVQGG
jgi:plasmid maintenance system antidote protein VapI